MKVVTALRTLIARQGLSVHKVAQGLGSNNTARLESVFQHGNPRFSNILGILGLCGYEVWFVPKDSGDTRKIICVDELGGNEESKKGRFKRAVGDGK